jgi:O-antigen ligase
MLKFIFGALLVSVGFAAAVFVEPVWGLYLFAALSHIRLEQLGESYTLPLRVPIVIGTLTLLLYFVSSKYPHKFRRWPPEVWLFGLMVGGLALSSWHAIFDAPAAWSLTFDYFKYWVFFVILIQMIDTKKRLDGFYWVLVISSAWLVFRAWDLRGTTGERFENIGGGNVADSNDYAAALVLLFPFVYQRTLSHKRTVAVGAACLCFGIVMAIVIANSRGGFLGLLTVSLLILLLIKVRRTQTLLAFAGVALVALAFTREYQLQRLLGVFGMAEGEEQDNSAHLRVVFWKLAWQLFQDHPLLGVGPGNFPYYSATLQEGLPYGTAGHVTHSLWFEMLSSGGLLLVGPLFILLWRFFRNSWRLARSCVQAGDLETALYVQVPLCSMGGFLVAATFIDRMVYEPLYWCLALGVVHRYLWSPVRETALPALRTRPRGTPVATRRPPLRTHA